MDSALVAAHQPPWLQWPWPWPKHVPFSPWRASWCYCSLMTMDPVLNLQTQSPWWSLLAMCQPLAGQQDGVRGGLAPGRGTCGPLARATSEICSRKWRLLIWSYPRERHGGASLKHSSSSTHWNKKKKVPSSAFNVILQQSCIFQVCSCEIVSYVGFSELKKW